MSWSDLRPWGIKWRYIALALFALALFFGGKKGDDKAPLGPEMRIAAGALEAEYQKISGRPFNVAMKNGSYEKSRPNDIEELAKDWIYFRRRILEKTASGDISGAQKAREDFQQVNRWLEQYEPSDVAFMVGRLEGK